MGYYQRHVFFCCNQRPADDPRGCCDAKGASRVRDYAKQKAKALGLSAPGKVRINQAGCLDRCAQGPVAVVYPEGVWYTYVDEEDVDEIIEEHLVNGRVVKRLQI